MRGDNSDMNFDGIKIDLSQSDIDYYFSPTHIWQHGVLACFLLSAYHAGLLSWAYFDKYHEKKKVYHVECKKRNKRINKTNVLRRRKITRDVRVFIDGREIK